jgi:hypothetical protein
MTKTAKMSENIKYILRGDTGFSVSARCTNAAAFVHKTPTMSGLVSLGTRLSKIFQNLPTVL